MQFVKIWFLPLVAITFVSLLALQQPTSAAPPDRPIRHPHQQNGVTLDKVASSELVNLGEFFSYTITIDNGGSTTIEPWLSDPLPQGLILQPDSLTATVGLVEVSDDILVWSGELSAGEEAVIIYEMISPSTSAEDQSYTNLATLQFDDTTLEADAIITTQQGDYGFLWSLFRPLVNLIAVILVYIDLLLETANVPYAFGFSIILFTVAIRALTFPLNMKQIKSAKAMQELQPKMKALQEKHKDDREALAMAQMTLYKEAGVNPLGGCLPMLIQMPVWISLYWALIQLSNEGLLTEGFFWIPSLAGPVTYQEHSLGWLWPFPPSVGWEAALSYLVLPVLLVVSQLYMQQMMTPPSTDPQQAQMQQMMKFMPLMFGYFALIVPSGLTLYWFTSNLLMVIQQYFTKTHLNQPALATSGNGTVSMSKSPPTDSSSAETNSEQSKKGKNVRSKRKSKRKR